MSEPYDSLIHTYKVISVSGDHLDVLSDQLDRKITSLTSNGFSLNKKAEVTFIGGVDITFINEAYYIMSQAVLIKSINTE